MEPKRPLEPNPPNTTDTFCNDLIQERISSERLLAFIDEKAPLEQDVDRAKREQLLYEVRQIFIDWVRDMAVEKGLYPNKEAAMEVRASIYLSGSYRLGYNSPDGDVDTICVCPNFITKDDFFASFVERIKLHPQYEDSNPLPDAGVPIVESIIAGINLDMGFARLITPTIPDNFNILDDDVLNGLDPSSRIALNGPRVTELIHRLVENLETFKVIVRALRLWAKRRGLYSNKLGFLGGVNFNILAAFICQLYPNYAPAAILLRFFAYFAQWVWPTPVHINKPYQLPHLNYDVWNPMDPRTRSHLMPILTPAYPAYNSSYSVTRHTRDIMVKEFMRGFSICDKIMAEPDATKHDWSKLFEPFEFFLSFDSYLVLEAIAPPEEVDKWAGFVESRVRNLVEILDQPDIPLSDIHPWIKIEKRSELINVEVADEQNTSSITSSITTETNTPTNIASATTTQSNNTTETNTTETNPEPSPTIPSSVITTKETGNSTDIIMKEVSSDGIVKSEKIITVTENDTEKDFDTVMENIRENEPRSTENTINQTSNTINTTNTTTLSSTTTETITNNVVPSIEVAVPIAEPTATTSSVTSDSATTVTSLHTDLIKQTRTITKEIGVRSFYIGLVPNTERLRTSSLNLTPSLRLFKQTRIFGARPYSKWKEGMNLRQRVIKWNQLPEEVFPEGREAAAVQRALLKEQQAKVIEAMIAATNEAIAVQRQNATYVKGQSSAPPLPTSDSTLTTISSDPNKQTTTAIDQGPRKLLPSDRTLINVDAMPFIPGINRSMDNSTMGMMIPGLSMSMNDNTTTLSSSNKTTVGQKRPAPSDDNNSNPTKRPTSEPTVPTIPSTTTIPFIPNLIPTTNPTTVPITTTTSAKKFKVQLLKK